MALGIYGGSGLTFFTHSHPLQTPQFILYRRRIRNSHFLQLALRQHIELNPNPTDEITYDESAHGIVQKSSNPRNLWLYEDECWIRGISI